jgi:16S rRNA (guanine527-N7)-methyltransferase
MIDPLETIINYFRITPVQEAQLLRMADLYRIWNEQINVISRKDIGEIYTRHILHSLSIAKIIDFKPGTRVIDVGCGGGFPGMPLAVLFPDVSFTLIDSIGKKIKVVNEVASALELENVTGLNERSEHIKMKFDFVLSRAVTAFPNFVKLTRHLVSNVHQNALPNGILYLKGGDFEDEIKPFRKQIELYPISLYFNDPYFETKKVIYLPVSN